MRYKTGKNKAKSGDQELGIMVSRAVVQNRLFSCFRYGRILPQNLILKKIPTKFAALRASKHTVSYVCFFRLRRGTIFDRFSQPQIFSALRFTAEFFSPGGGGSEPK